VYSTGNLSDKGCTVTKTKAVSTDDTALVAVLCRLHDWEMENAPLLRCTTGRQLYFSVAQGAVARGYGPMVKEVINSKHITDRALRSRLRTLVRQGYIHLEPSTKTDRRIKLIRPSVEFEGDLNGHLQAFKLLLQDHFYLVERQKSQTHSSATRKNP